MPSRIMPLTVLPAGTGQFPDLRAFSTPPNRKHAAAGKNLRRLRNLSSADLAAPLTWLQPFPEHLLLSRCRDASCLFRRPCPAKRTLFILLKQTGPARIPSRRPAAKRLQPAGLFRPVSFFAGSLSPRHEKTGPACVAACRNGPFSRACRPAGS